MRKYPKKKVCWCLSGLPFIECHFNKKKNYKDIKPIQKIIKKTISKPECLHKNISPCSDQVIKAHSISKRISLSTICQNNHVYGLKLGFNEIEFKKIGVNDASTFHGFCKKHDELLFSSFEKKDFLKTNKQLFDLCYRAICQEHYTMLRVIDSLNEVKKNIDKDYSLIDQICFQAEINSQIIFYQLGVKYSNSYKKQLEKKYYVSKHEDDLEHYIFELQESYPKFQSSSCFNLEYDLNGNRLQDLDKAEIQSKNIFINCISLQSKGYFIISWFKENNDFGKQIINSIISSPSRIEDKLFSFTFLYIFNTFVSPKWFESLTEIQKIELKKLQDFWNEQNKFSPSMIISNMNSIRIKKHYFYKDTI
ncbi:MAG: hypothetical protein KBC72_11920 [Acinetobacter sp.]|nr:hypothetical protein [Acinetobacter sp.]